MNRKFKKASGLQRLPSGVSAYGLEAAPEGKMWFPFISWPLKYLPTLEQKDHAPGAKTGYMTLKVYTFNDRLIGRIPDKYFPMIRYAVLFSNLEKQQKGTTICLGLP